MSIDPNQTTALKRAYQYLYKHYDMDALAKLNHAQMKSAVKNIVREIGWDPNASPGCIVTNMLISNIYSYRRDNDD